MDSIGAQPVKESVYIEEDITVELIQNEELVYIQSFRYEPSFLCDMGRGDGENQSQCTRWARRFYKRPNGKSLSLCMNHIHECALNVTNMPKHLLKIKHLTGTQSRKRKLK